MSRFNPPCEYVDDPVASTSTSEGLRVMAGFFGENFQGLSRTEKLGAIAALMQVVYQCEFSGDWTLHDELESGRYDELSPQVKGAILTFDEDTTEDAIDFCTGTLLKMAMHGGERCE